MLTPKALRTRRRCWSQVPKSVNKALELTTEMVDSIVNYRLEVVQTGDVGVAVGTDVGAGGDFLVASVTSFFRRGALVEPEPQRGLALRPPAAPASGKSGLAARGCRGSHPPTPASPATCGTRHRRPAPRTQTRSPRRANPQQSVDARSGKCTVSTLYRPTSVELRKRSTHIVIIMHFSDRNYPPRT